MAFAKAAQLLFVFLIVILIVKATPVLSSLISDLTNDEGVIVGKGPAVSEGDTEQLPLPPPEPVSVPVSVSVVVRSSFLQACNISGTDVAPMKNCLRNFFLDCSIVFHFNN
jgi:hypothetical protein